MNTKTKTECNTNLCNYDSATRPRFYNGMLLTDEHLRLEQQYHREALKRVNRHLFGSGIVCGLKVSHLQTGLCIKVDPGVALDCCGNLIEVCKCITLDLTNECKKKFGEDCKTPDDPKPITKFLVLRYVELEDGLEPVLTPPQDCQAPGDKPNCQASKVREGYCVELWDKCPCPEPEAEALTDLSTTLKDLGKYQSQPTATPLQGAQQGNLEKAECLDLPLACSPCGCCDSAVGLAELTIDCVANTVRVEGCNCQRYVMSPGLLKWILSRLNPQIFQKEMAELYPRLGDRATANLLIAAVEFEQWGTAMKKLQTSETKRIVDSEIKKVRVEEKKLREGEIKKLREELQKKFSENLTNLEKKLTK